jgi:hypothetical protein
MVHPPESAERERSSREEPHASPVTLERYAAVMAALGAGLPLTRALSHAEVEPIAWTSAEERWRAELAESGASDLTLLVAFDGALLRARRAFEPTIEPIASDPRAWSCFRRHFVTAVDPAAFLREHGIALATMAGLEADWANRVLSDTTLAAAMKEHLDSPLEPCPTLVVTPSPLLEESRDTPALAAPPPTPAPPFPRPVPAAPMSVAHVAPVAPAPSTPTYLAAAPPEPPARPLPPPAHPPIAAERPSLGATMMSFTAVPGPALPFTTTSAATPPTPPPAPPLPSSPPAPAGPQHPVGPEGAAPPAVKRRSPITMSSVAAPPASALPFAQPRAAPSTPPPMADSVKGPTPSPTPRGTPVALSLEQYASLCVELARSPSPEPVLTRYGLSAEQGRALEAHYGQLFATSPAVRTAFDAASALYEAWLSSARPK